MFLFPGEGMRGLRPAAELLRELKTGLAAGLLLCQARTGWDCPTRLTRPGGPTLGRQALRKGPTARNPRFPPAAKT